jgi:hypothetical protein
VINSSFIKHIATIGEVLRLPPERLLKKISSAHFFRMRRISRIIVSNISLKCLGIKITMEDLSLIICHQLIIYLTIMEGPLTKISKNIKDRMELKKYLPQNLTLKTYLCLIFPLRCWHRATL